jgi:hypothetical protein
MTQSFDECKLDITVLEPQRQVKLWELTKTSFFEMLSLKGERDKQELAKITN